MSPDLFCDLIHCFIVFFDRIPFIVNDDHTFSSFVSKTRHVLILFPDPTFAIDYDENDIRSLDSALGTKDRILFNILINLSALSDTRSINDHIFFIIKFKRSIDRISCRTLYIADNDTILFQDRVHKRAFSNVWTANDTKRGNPFVIGDLLIWHIFNRDIHQITQA